MKKHTPHILIVLALVALVALTARAQPQPAAQPTWPGFWGMNTYITGVPVATERKTR